MKKNFLSTGDYSAEELEKIIKLAIGYKTGNTKLPDFSDKILTLIFDNPSLRTRLSFESGMAKMKGKTNVLNTSDSWKFEYKDNAIMNEDKQEHIKEAAKVISKYTDLIGIRKCELINKSKEAITISNYGEYKQDIALNKLAELATVPVINMESNMHHPCQSMADMMTLYEKFDGNPKGKKYVLTWVPHLKPLPLATPHSQLITPIILGMDVTLSCPENYELDPEIMEKYKVKTVHDQNEALKGVDVVVAKSWASIKFWGDFESEEKYRKNLSDWMITGKKMQITNNAYLMHCLPMRRNVEITDEVVESKNCLVVEEAENRMWVQMALITYLLNN